MTRGHPNQMKIRLPNDVKEWIKDQAEAEQRTQNGQILHLLTRAMIEHQVRKETT